MAVKSAGSSLVIRLFVTHPLTDGIEFALESGAFRYLTTVMRQYVGAEILVFNGRDGEWRARIAHIGKREARLEINALTRPQRSGPALTLFVALIKRAPLELIVEKATELGAAKISLVLTHRTNADHTNLARLSAIATEAAEQTGRLDVPVIEAPERLDRRLERWAPSDSLIFCDEIGPAPPIGSVLGTQAEPGAVLIGPEGGFSPDERQRLRDLPFVQPVSLGPRILRADTAALAALSLWQALAGDWRNIADIAEEHPI